jgi:hypothetical protein
VERGSGAIGPTWHNVVVVVPFVRLRTTREGPPVNNQCGSIAAWQWRRRKTHPTTESVLGMSFSQQSNFFEKTYQIKKFGSEANLTQSTLCCRLYRFDQGIESERLLFQKFRQMSLRVIPKRANDWETLFDMQHYGLPTRLMDWSSNLGIATFFAARYNRHRTNAAIYILDPLTLNQHSRIDRIPLLPEDTYLDYRSIFWEKRPYAPIYPIAVEPIFSNDRMLAAARYVHYPWRRYHAG